MGRHYDQLGLEERCTIARLHASGASIRKIAAALDRPPSAVCRELKRNSGRDTGYRPAHAEEKARARRWTGCRLERDADLRARVLGCLERGWSPEQVAGRLRREAGATVISHESIYRFIHAQIRRTGEGRWRLYLPQARARRGRRSNAGRSPVRFFKDRVSIEDRPPSVASRRIAGHWEGDLMAFSKYGQAILVAHERKSRLILLARQPSKAADPVARRLGAWFRALPPALRRSITFDNGTEFALHYRLNHDPGVKTFFCDTHSPWQKGGVENAIGRMRRRLPRKTDLATLPIRRINDAVDAYNNTPRKCLGYKTPAEAFSAFLKPLHFKCESTRPISAA
jgi:IS30 family transposase